MARLRAVMLAVVMALLLALAPSVAGPAIAPVRAGIPEAPACVVGTELVVNGSFEQPASVAPGTSANVRPDAWNETVTVADSDDAPAGDQYASFGSATDPPAFELSQDLASGVLDDGGQVSFAYTLRGTGDISIDLLGYGLGKSLDPGSFVTTSGSLSIAPGTGTPNSLLSFSVVDASGQVEIDAVTIVITNCIDATEPVITLGGGVQDGQTYARRNLPPAPTCTATDAVDGPVACDASGYETGFGTHTITYTATDAAGNTATATVTYTVAERAVGPTATARPPIATQTPRPTQRPRPNPTEAPVPIEPTFRPTPRPRPPTLTPTIPVQNVNEAPTAVPTTSPTP